MSLIFDYHCPIMKLAFCSIDQPYFGVFAVIFQHCYTSVSSVF